jgi:phosphohistidine phosphatase
MIHLELYLIRHGIAEDRAKDGRDASRALTDEGIERLREVAAGLTAIGVRWDLVLTSPYLRARQTADVLLREMGGERPRLAVTDSLVPEADLEAVLAELPSAASGESSVALVSHEPLMGHLVGRLLGTGTSMPMKKGGVCRIDFDEAPTHTPGTLKWLAPPKLLRKLDG